MSENERVRIIRKVKGLTLEKFGQLIGMGKSSISDIENGRRPLTNQSRLSICRTFGINEDWLRNGKGQMFLEIEMAAINDVADQYHLSDLDKEALRIYLNLDENGRQSLMTFLLSFTSKILETPALYRQYKQAQGKLQKLSQGDIEVEVAAYRAELEFLAAEKEEEPVAGTPSGVAEAEALYESSSGFVPNKDLSASNTTDGTAPTESSTAGNSEKMA